MGWSLHDWKMWLVSKMENKMGQKHYVDFTNTLATMGMNPFTMYSIRSLDLISSGAAEIGEVLATMRKLGSNRPYKEMKEAWWIEWGHIAAHLEKRADESAAKNHSVGAASAYLRATEYHRQSFFFLRDNLSDPRVSSTCERMQRCFKSSIKHSGLPLQPVAVPYKEGTELAGYFAVGRGAAPGERRPIVIHVGDYDGCSEEQWLSTGRHAWERGYHVLVIDGPGQGSSLWCKGIFFPSKPESVMDSIAAWMAVEKPEADLEKVILIGRKYGGYLATHIAAAVADRGQAAAAEAGSGSKPSYTIAAVAVAPLYIDMGTRSIPGMLSPKAQALFAKRKDDEVNALMLQDMRTSSYVDFAIRTRAGCHGFADTPAAWLRRYNDDLNSVDKLSAITCPVWAGMHTDKPGNHQTLDDKEFNKISNLTVERFSVDEDGTLGTYWEGGAAGTMERMMGWVEDTVAVV